MTPTVELMQSTARTLCRRALSGDPEYRAMTAEAEVLRAQFRKEHPDALCARVLQILDACLGRLRHGRRAALSDRAPDGSGSGRTGLPAQGHAPYSSSLRRRYSMAFFSTREI